MTISAGLSRRALLCGGALALSLVANGFAHGAAAQADKKQASDHILFVSDRDKPGEYAVYAMNPDGSGQTRLSKDEGIHFDPAWSPDRKQVVYSRLAGKDKPTVTLCVMKADGSEPTVLATGEEKTIYIAPSWAPDGKHIAYSLVNAAGANPSSAIYVMDPDGKNSKKLADGAVPVWSPDGKRLLFSPMPTREGAPELKVMDADGTNVKTLAGKGFGPCWSPDGKHIAFTSEGNQRPAIFVMDADGSHVTQLTKDALALGPIWTPDGKHILYTQGGPGGTDRPQTEVWLMDSDGSNGKAVTKSDSFVGTGTSLLFVMQAAHN